MFKYFRTVNNLAFARHWKTSLWLEYKKERKRIIACGVVGRLGHAYLINHIKDFVICINIPWKLLEYFK